MHEIGFAHVFPNAIDDLIRPHGHRITRSIAGSCVVDHHLIIASREVLTVYTGGCPAPAADDAGTLGVHTSTGSHGTNEKKERDPLTFDAQDRPSLDPNRRR